MEEVLIEVKLNEQTIPRLLHSHPSYFQGEGLGMGSWASEQMNEGKVSRLLWEQLIEITDNSCYIVFAFPPIFRDGARGGLNRLCFLTGASIKRKSVE